MVFVVDAQIYERPERWRRDRCWMNAAAGGGDMSSRIDAAARSSILKNAFDTRLLGWFCFFERLELQGIVP